MADVRGIVRQFICDNFIVDEGELDDDDSMLDREIIDSTGVLELVAFLEQRFQIHVGEQEMIPENLDSVNRICEFLRRACGDTVVAGDTARAVV